MSKQVAEIDVSRTLSALTVKLGDRAPKAVASAIWREANAIMTTSKEQYCPVDTGNLRRSGVVLPPEVNGTSIEVVIGYGSEAPYAEVVHEDLTAKNWNKSGTGPKYLERPFLAALPGMDGRIAERIAQAVK